MGGQSPLEKRKRKGTIRLKFVHTHHTSYVRKSSQPIYSYLHQMIHHLSAGRPLSPTMKKANPWITANSDSLSLIAGLQSGTCLIFKDHVFSRPDGAHFQSYLGFPFQQYQATVSLTLADDRIFCFYPKPPLTFSIFLEKPAKLQLSFSLRMADAVVHLFRICLMYSGAT